MPAPEPAPKRAKRADATTPEKDVVADGCDLANSAPAPLSTSLENAAPTRDDDDTLPTRDDGVDEALPTRDDDDTLPTVASDGVDGAAGGVGGAAGGRFRRQAACPTSALQNSRRALNLEASDAALRAAVATYVASSGAGALARAYVGGGALEVQGVQDIRVVARCGPQELHRDHQMGPRKGAVIALSLDGAPLGTEFVAGTHLVEEGAALSRYVADNRYATKRAPKAAAMERHLRAARLLAAADASLMVYDPFPGGEAYDAPSEGPSALSHLLRVVNVGLSVMMAATGASSLAAMWFTFEASQVYPCDAVVAQLKRNFGFLYNAIGKALFVIFCGFLNFGVRRTRWAS
ncbi:hypothetical protein JL722_11561 [Aureococcus anophagefferens]|nr:hypothetical protein JL722_11561 [Aureococcus anophagefferens]